MIRIGDMFYNGISGRYLLVDDIKGKYCWCVVWEPEDFGGDTCTVRVYTKLELSNMQKL